MTLEEAVEQLCLDLECDDISVDRIVVDFDKEYIELKNSYYSDIAHRFGFHELVTREYHPTVIESLCLVRSLIIEQQEEIRKRYNGAKYIEDFTYVFTSEDE